jgi:hypothetical protein
MLGVEFALVTALCLVPTHHLGRREIYAYAASAVLVVPGVSLGLAAAAAAAGRALHREVVQAQDVKEYEPHGFPIAPELNYSELGLGALAQMPPVTCVPSVKVCRVTSRRFGEMHIEVEGSVPTEVTARRFYFPGWTIGDPAITPTEKYRLVSFVALPGHGPVHLRRAALPIEQWGWMISGVALLLLGAIAAVTARNSSRAGR